MAELLTLSLEDDLGQALTREVIEDKAGTSQVATKTKIVEMAIEYISAQQKVIREMRTKLEECQTRLVERGGVWDSSNKG